MALLKFTASDYHALASKLDLAWLGPFPGNSQCKTKWQCACGNTFEVCYAQLKYNNHGNCPQCSNRKKQDRKRKKPADYHALAEERGLEWLGPEVRNNKAKTWFRCANGHEWETCYAKILYYGCPICAGNVPKTEADYHELAKRQNLEWLGDTAPFNTRTKTDWRCASGHVWQSTYNDIQHGYLCPRCTIHGKRLPEDYHALAASKGYEWLGPEVETTFTETTWRCDQGHDFKRTYASIREGNQCTECSFQVNGKPTSKAQRQLAEWTGGILNANIGPFNVDVYIEQDSIVIEYDGWYWHNHKLDSDQERYNQLVKEGYKVLQIKGRRKTPKRRDVQRALDKLRSGEQWVTITMSDWAQE